jgi:hypothetical protein
MRIHFPIKTCILFVFTIVSSVAVCEGESVNFNIIITREYAALLGTHIPKEFGIELMGSKKYLINPWDAIPIPKATIAEPAPRRIWGEDDEKFKKRLKDSGLSFLQMCNLALDRRTKVLADHAQNLNNKFEQFADTCGNVTGTRLCLHINANIDETSDSAAERLVSDDPKKQALFVIFAPDHFQMLTEGSYKGSEKNPIWVPPILDKNKIGFREISLPEFAGFQRPGIRIPGFKLGKLVIAWNKEATHMTLAESRELGAKKLAESIDKGTEALIHNPDVIAQAGVFGFSLELVKPAANLGEEALKRIIAYITDSVERKLLCSAPASFENPKSEQKTDAHH